MIRRLRVHALRAISFALLLSFLVSAGAAAQTRVKDLVNFDGVRRNQLIGYGLVVGLNGTGDRLTNAPFTEQSLKGMLERLGINTREEVLRTRNAAAVMVTAFLPPFARQGATTDVTVSALGDASSLQGGTLLVTPLLGADGQAYAVAQGALSVAGFSASGVAASVTKGVPTTARIPGGAIVERELKFALDDTSTVRMILRNPDFTTANRIAAAVGRKMGGGARALDATTVDLRVPPSYVGAVARLIGDIEQLRVDPDGIARVTIDERSGTIIIGDDVRISKVAVTQGNLTVRVVETPEVSQPEPFSRTGTTEIVPRTNVDVREGGPKPFVAVGGNVSLQQLVRGLNALGVAPRDMIAILQAIKAAGALHAELEII